MNADGCTAAITQDGELYTWGDGAGGNLGYGNTLRQFIPRQVEKGLGDFNITQVCYQFCWDFMTISLSFSTNVSYLAETKVLHRLLGVLATDCFCSALLDD